MNNNVNSNEKNHGSVNIVNNAEFKSKIRDIIMTCASIVSQTLGPFGKNTLIQTSDGITKTKDGWNVLKAMKFNTIVDNSIKGVVEEICSQVVLKVGDGSTTSVIAASIMNNVFGEYLQSQTINTPIRDIDGALTATINAIIEELENMATKIEVSDLKEFMYKIALVSTNWDTDTATMISDIISKTNNPIISTSLSGTDSTEITIIEDSYDLAGEYVEDLFVNVKEDGLCDIQNPKVLVFDHSVREEYIGLLLNYYIGLSSTGTTPLVIMAPDFTETFKTQYKNYLVKSYQQTKGIPMLIPVKYIRASNFDRQCIGDFAIMCGSTIVTKTDELTNAIKELSVAEPNVEVVDRAFAILEGSLGECDNYKVDKKLITITGLSNRNEEEYQRVLGLAANGLGEKLNESSALSMLTADVKLRKHRLGKLQCRMGTIKLGGYGQADLKAKKDALDDAIRACESAYYNGYNIGSSMAVPVACSRVKASGRLTSDLELVILDCILETFKGVFTTIVENKTDGVIAYQSKGKLNIDEIINKCIEDEVAYNLITDEFDTDRQIINPSTTDIEVLRGMLNLVLMNFTSNQFLFTHFDDLFN